MSDGPALVDDDHNGIEDVFGDQSSMSRIGRLTETTGFIAPHSCGVTTNPDEEAEADVDDGEHRQRSMPAARRPSAAIVDLA